MSRLKRIPIRTKGTGRENLNELVSGYPAYPASRHYLFQPCHWSLTFVLLTLFLALILSS